MPPANDNLLYGALMEWY